MVQDTIEQTFIKNIHESSGISVDKLNEVLSAGMVGKSSIVFGKAAVYNYLDEIGASTITEDDGDDSWIRTDEVDYDDAIEKAFGSYFSILSDEEFISATELFQKEYKGNDSVVRRTVNGLVFNRVAMIPIIKTLIRQVKGLPAYNKDEDDVDEDAFSSPNSRYTRQVDHLVAKARNVGMTAKDFIRKGEQAEQHGDPKASIYLDVAKRLSADNLRFSEADGENEELIHRIYDTVDKVWVGKPSKQLRRLRNRADKKDLEYGAIRYNVQPYSPAS